MAHQIFQRSPKKKDKSRSFLGCFWFSGTKKNTRWFCPKQKSAAKTVPLVDATEEKVNRSKQIRVVNSDSSVGATDEKPQLRRTSSTGKSLKKKKFATTVGAADSAGYNRETTSNLQDNNFGSTRYQDFAYGMRILTMILMIMLVWGKLCAILCTAACFYFEPRIKTTNQEPGIEPENTRPSKNIHFSSEESNRKVVLDGFLERNHRIVRQ